jgi:hypothetical protein
VADPTLRTLRSRLTRLHATMSATSARRQALVAQSGTLLEEAAQRLRRHSADHQQHKHDADRQHPEQPRRQGPETA